MRFLCLYKPAKEEGLPPSQEEMGEMGTLIDEMVKAGVLLSTEGCQPSSKGARVRLSGGKLTVTDTLYRGEGADWRFRDYPDDVEGGSDRTDQAVPQSGGRR